MASCTSAVAALLSVIALTGCSPDENDSTAADSSSPRPSATAPEASESSDPPADASGCQDPSRNCLGVLDPGTYQSTYLDVFATGNAGQFTYTVGPGWANTLDHVPSYWLRPEDTYQEPDWDYATSGIYVWTNVAAAKQESTCPEESDTSVGTGAADLADWLSQLPGLTVKEQPSRTIDGHRAIVLDVQVTGAQALCGADAPMFANRPGAPDPWVNGINTSEANRVMLFDLPDGHTAEVVVAGPKTELKQLVANSLPVIASMHFTS